MTGVHETVVIDRSSNAARSAAAKRGNPLAVLWGKRAWFGYLFAAFVVYIGWQGRFERNITAEDGLGYALGIIGASMMITLLIYPLRKRIRFLKVLGATRHWFRIHMILGIVGPVLILYHSNFSVGSLNSKVALFCTLLVACSGIVGRYLYSKIHNGLYGKKTSLRTLVQEMQQSVEDISDPASPTREIHEQLVTLNNAVLDPPTSLAGSMIRPFRLSAMTRSAYWRLRKNASVTPEMRKDLRRHMKQVRRVAHLSFYERLFSLWHILHLPFFVMLVLSAIVHVLAVHMY